MTDDKEVKQPENDEKMEGVEEAVQKEEQGPQTVPEDVQMLQPLPQKAWVFGGSSASNTPHSFANNIQNTEGQTSALNIFKDFKC